MTAPSPIRWIDRPEIATAFIGNLPDAPIALDTEFMRTQTYYAELALVQVRCGEELALIDPCAPGVVQVLGPLLADARDKILHSASEDLDVLLRALGAVPAPLFDTQIAATLCGAALPPSYQKLVASELGVELAKGATRSDWLQRPLSEEQMQYAADDVRYLPALHGRLFARLTELGRLPWLYEEGERAATKAREADANPHLKVRSAERLTAAQQQRLWRLLTWREREARARNRPRTWILDNAIAQRVALLDKPSPQALANACTIDGRAQPRLVEKLERIVMAAPTEDELVIPLASELNDSEKARAREIKTLVDARAGALGMSADFLLPRRGIEHWAREGELPSDLRGWRSEVLA